MELVQGKHLTPWGLLPAKPGTCPQCAVAHDANYPHNAQSMYYKYYFYNQHGRWPNWMDAMEHCELSMQLLWLFELEIAGVDVESGQVNPMKLSS